jgi:hypothetical protein
MAITKLIAEWKGEEGDFYIDIPSDDGVIRVGQWDRSVDIDQVIYMTKADAQAVITGLQNAIAALDEGDEE